MTSSTVAASPARRDAISRIANDRDVGFLRELFVRDRLPEFLAAGLPATQCHQLLADQFRIQTAAYAHEFPHADTRVLLDDDDPVGRIIIDRGHDHPDHLYIVDLLIDPDHRNRGLGTAALRQVQDEARSAGVAVELTVRAESPARRLYERLGFEPLGGSHEPHTTPVEGDQVRLRWRSV